MPVTAMSSSRSGTKRVVYVEERYLRPLLVSWLHLHGLEIQARQNHERVCCRLGDWIVSTVIFSCLDGSIQALCILQSKLNATGEVYFDKVYEYKSTMGCLGFSTRLPSLHGKTEEHEALLQEQD
jgi:hypothetical protein